MKLASFLPVLLLAVGAAALPQAIQYSGTAQENSCHWRQFKTDEGVTSWEFQMRAKHNMERTRAEWQAVVEDSFARAERQLPSFRMDRGSKRSMIWRETEQRLSTDDGRPLDSAESHAQFPWSQIAVLRLRACIAVEAPPGEEHPRHLLLPGQADLTLKLKGVPDPATFPRVEQDFPTEVEGAQLAVKMENDVHCRFSRTSYSAVFRRTTGVTHKALRSPKGVLRYFPTLPGLLRLPEDYKLPLYMDHYQSKTYYDVQYGEMHGTVQIYLNSTSREAAVSGSRATMMEMSMRLARKDASTPRHLADSLRLIASLCEVLGEHGWKAAPTSAAAEAAAGAVYGEGAEREGVAARLDSH